VSTTWWQSRLVFVIASVLLPAMVGWHVEAIGGQLTVAWNNNSTNEVGFSVERSTGTTGPFAEIGTPSGVTTYVDTNLADATTYCYRVRAYNSAGYSDYSNVACGTTPRVFGLAVVKTGTGSGTVTSVPAGINCGSNCSASYPSGTAVTLTAAPASGSTFTGWTGGGCSGTGSCIVTLTAATSATATFDLSQSVTLVSPAKVWVGIGDAGSAGIRVDLKAKVYVDSAVVAVGQHNSVNGGIDPHFSFAKLRSIPLTLTNAPVEVKSRSELKIRVLVRNACSGSGQPSGTVRLWYNGSGLDTGPGHGAASHFDATIEGVTSSYFLRSGFVLNTSAGSSRERAEVAVGEPCGPWVNFGAWSVSLP
jgi:Divergent InlB B-repeat domain